VPARHLAANDDGDRLAVRASRELACGESLVVRQKDSNPSLAALGVHAFGQLRHMLESCEGRFAETFPYNAIEAVDATGCVEYTPVRQSAGGCRRCVMAREEVRRSEDRRTPSNETSHRRIDGSAPRTSQGKKRIAAIRRELGNYGEVAPCAEARSSPNTGTVAKVPLGGGTTTTLASGQNFANAIAIDGTNAYGTNEGTGSSVADGTVMKVALGGGPVTTLAFGQNNPQAIAATSLFWADTNDVPPMYNELGTIVRLMPK
jgi:hypothetical protein